MQTATVPMLVVLALLSATNPPTFAQENTSQLRAFAFGTPDSVLRSSFTKVIPAVDLDAA